MKIACSFVIEYLLDKIFYLEYLRTIRTLAEAIFLP